MILSPSFIIGFHVIFGAIFGAFLSRLVLRTDARHEGVEFSFLSLTLVRTRKGAYWGFQLFLSVLLGLIFYLNAQFLGAGWALIFWQLMSLLFISAAVYDLAFRLIPVSLVVSILVLSVVSPLFFSFPLPFWSALGGSMAVGGLVSFLYLVTRGRGIGEADVLLAFVIGLLFGWMKGLLVFAAANMLGLIVVLPLIAVFGKKRMRQIPLVFFLVFAIFFEWYVGYTGWIESVLEL